MRPAIVLGPRRPLQNALDLIGGQRFRQHLPLPRRIDVQRGVGGDVAVEQQVLVEVPQRRKLARHAASVHAIRQQRIEEVADILPPRLAQRALALQQKFRVLIEIGVIGRHAQRRQSLLDLQVVEKGVQQPQIGIGTLHEMSMKAAGRYGNNERGTGGIFTTEALRTRRKQTNEEFINSVENSSGAKDPVQRALRTA